MRSIFFTWIVLALGGVANAWGQVQYAVTDLGTLPGGSSSFAYGINNSGQIVGDAYANGTALQHAFLYSGGSMQDLGTLGGQESYAYGINDSGLIVGYSDISDGGDDAFLYNHGTMEDLNNLIASDSGWTLEEATGINVSGQICGYGMNPSGQTDAFLLTPTPTPEPYTFVLLGVGAVGFLGSALRRKRAT